MSILSSAEFGILRLVIERPARRNTISSEMYAALAENLRAAQDDPKIRVVLLKGAADVFSAGDDLEESLKDPQKLERESRLFFEALRAFEKPIVAQVNGPCVGNAFAILLHCDLVYAVPRALFSYPCVALARTPRFGVACVMSAAAGHPRACEKLLLSQPISAEEAVDMRLITAIIEEDRIDNAVAAAVSRLAVLPPNAVAATKRMLVAAKNRFIAMNADTEESLFAKQAASPEAKEALQAFLDGRKPVFNPD